MSIQQTGSQFRLQSMIQMAGKRPHSDSVTDAGPSKRQKAIESIVFVTLEQIPDLMTGDELAQELAQNLRRNGLSFGNPFCSWHQISQGKFRMKMRSKRQAESLCWFNGMVLTNGPKSSTVKCDREDDWKGPPPQYKSYDEFILHEGQPMDLSYKPKIKEAVPPTCNQEDGRNKTQCKGTNPTLVPNDQSKEQFPVNLVHHPKCKSVADTVAFLNQVMRDEGFLDHQTTNAIVNYRRNQRSTVLEMANRELQKKICWLNATPWSSFGIVRISGPIWSVKPQYTSWADFKAKGRIPTIRVYLRNPPHRNRDDLVQFFNTKMWQYGLARNDELGVIRFQLDPLGANVGSFEVANGEMREKLLYLNGIGGYKDTKYCFQLEPHSSYKGSPPKYRCFSDFFKDFETQNQSLSDSIHQLESIDRDQIRKPSSGSQAQGSTHSKSNQHFVKNTSSGENSSVSAQWKHETEQLKKQVSRLQKSNDDLNKSLSNKAQAANYFQSMFSKVKEELATAKGQLDDVHQSWQEQASDIAHKDAQLAKLQGCVDELTECVAKRDNVVAAQTQAFLNETMKRQKAEEILSVLQMENMKQQARILATMSALNPPVSKKEEIDHDVGGTQLGS